MLDLNLSNCLFSLESCHVKSDVFAFDWWRLRSITRRMTRISHPATVWLCSYPFLNNASDLRWLLYVHSLTFGASKGFLVNFSIIWGLSLVVWHTMFVVVSLTGPVRPSAGVVTLALSPFVPAAALLGARFRADSTCLLPDPNGSLDPEAPSQANMGRRRSRAVLYQLSGHYKPDKMKTKLKLNNVSNKGDVCWDD